MTDLLMEKADKWAGYDYDELVTSRGASIVTSESDDGYEGDTYYLLAQDGRYGYLVVGWGSCSGCDALEACVDFGDVRDLRDRLLSEVTWGTAAEVAAHIEARTELTDFYAREPAFKEFKRQAAIALSTAPGDADSPLAR
jgi:hypothetical protein